MNLFNFFLFSSIVLMFLSNNWVVIWVLLEVTSMCLVILLSEKMTPRSVEAVLKYFIMQAIGGLFLLFGVIVRLYFCNSVSVLSFYNESSYILILLGLFIKLAVFPNPFWVIDVVSGISVSRGFYVLVASKIIPLYLYITLINNSFLWTLIGVGVFSTAFGVLLGVNQLSVRKLLAFSSVGHVGWMVAVFPSMNVSSCFLVFVLYILNISPIFFWSLYYELEDVNKTKNVYHNFLVVFVLVVSLLSLAGLPPLAGFFYKWVMFNALVLNKLYLVSGVLILLNLISLFFYLNICKFFYLVYLPLLRFNVYSNAIIGVGNGVVVLLNGIILLALWFIGPFSSLCYI
uniref:NADH-ubiquinone oxidoreductase chain 2 n=1 Tax=Ophiarachnella infernalis TaxID=2587522 RepID=A0A513X072_9ECHI|nr:NADH dehydrogenase subunit 2 [Ophiarachnella infernalis]